MGRGVCAEEHMESTRVGRGVRAEKQKESNRRPLTFDHNMVNGTC